MNLITARFLSFLTILLQVVNGSFLQSFPCSSNKGSFDLANFVVDVGLDEENEKLKFFFNSMVNELHHDNSSVIEIYDTNSTTNTYSTFHAEIKFMGKVFWEENKRLCDIVAVKNISTLPGTTRYNVTHESGSINIGAPSHIGKRKVYYGQELTCDNCLSESNTTIEFIFGNSTGDLIQCPLYSGDSFQIYYEVDVSNHIRGLGSYTARFSVIANDEDATLLRCDKYYVTTVLSEKISFSILIGTLVFMIATALFNFFIVIYSSYQESSNPLLFTASTICNEKLLRQLEATLSQILRYLQFALFMAGLDLQYPGFFQPLMIDIRWCALLGITFFSNTNSPTETDNVYTTLNSTGLKNLAVYSTNQTESNIWQNFIICLIIWLMVSILFQTVYQMLKYAYNFFCKNKLPTDLKVNFNPDLIILYKYYYQIVGYILKGCFQLFAVPFLTLTMFMLSTASNKKIVHNYWDLLIRAFNPNVSYNDLIFSKGPPKEVSDSVYNNTLQYLALVNSTSIADEDLSSNSIPLTSIICGSLLLILWVLLFLYFTFKYILTIRSFRLVRSNNISKLYSSMKVIVFWAFSYHTYSPDKVYFTVIQYLFILFRSIVVGCLQNHGITQVILFILIELSNLLALAFIRPYFLNMSWTSTQVIMPVARLLIALLSIPYIRALNFTEEARTYVSFAQIAIHCVVAVAFFMQLIYCVSITILSIIRRSKSPNKGEHDVKESAQDYEDLIKDFEYYPLTVPFRTYNIKDNQMNQSVIDDDIDNESIYFRINSERQLLESQIAKDLKSSPLNTFENSENYSFMEETVNNDYTINSDSDVYSFSKQQHDSNLRRRKNDYTVREGDLIFQKYFCDDEIDPEVQQLWQSRNWAKHESEANRDHKSDTKLMFSNKFETIWKKIFPSQHNNTTNQKSFEVSRPKQIVVRNLPNDR